MAVTFSYTDGVEVEARILAILRGASDLGSNVSIGSSLYDDFAVRYHLCRQRSNLLRHLEFEGLRVLELGAGMGGVSRFLAEKASHLTAVEGSANRLEALKERLRDLDNWSAVRSTIQDYHPEEKYDVVCLVGVLEYSEVYIRTEDGSSPFEWVLRHARSMLKPDGVLVVAIENRRGLKYWAGAAEDHTSRLFDGICGYGFAESPRTFSRRRLLSLTVAAGFQKVEEFFPWPDYKLPTAMMSADLLERYPMVAAELAGEQKSRDPRQNPQLFPESLALLDLTGEGDMADFANSFLMVAATTPDSEVLKKLLMRKDQLGELAWHYAQGRRIPKETRFVESPEGLYVRKVAEVSPDQAPLPIQSDLVSEPVYHGYRLSTILTARAYFGRVDHFDRDLERFLRWSLKHWASDRGRLRPEALDALATNTIVQGENFQPFDLEWRWTEPIPASWFIFRNVFVLRDIMGVFTTPRFTTLRDWYVKLCGDLGVKPDYEGDLMRCRDFQYQVGLFSDPGGVEIAIRAIMESSISPAGYLRQPESLADLTAGSGSVTRELTRLRMENKNLKSELTKTAFRIARVADRAVKGLPFLIPLLKRITRSG